MKELKEATSRESGTEEAKGGDFYYEPLCTVDTETICSILTNVIRQKLFKNEYN